MPGTRYHADCQLVTWHPRGQFDEELADRIVEFMESKERIIGKSFHRFTDLSGLDRIHINLNHVFEIARRRRRGYCGAQVKSAIFAVRLISITIARMYQELMEGSAIDVGVFRDRAAAASWLKVAEEFLNPPPANAGGLR